MAYQTQRLKSLQQKMDTLKLGKIQTEHRLDIINGYISKYEILIRQEKDRTERLKLGDK